MSDKNIEYKTFSFNVNETKEIDINGEKYGIVKGYAATFGNIDRGKDIILAGAFSDSLQSYIEKKRPLKMHYQHSYMEIIGGFPPDKIQEDAKGIFVEGHINLKVQRGKEVYALTKQGVVSDFSIRYSVDDAAYEDDLRILKKVTLWEVSLVGEPMNEEAAITEVKTVTPYQNLLLADKDKQWDSSAAIKRVKAFTDSTDEPSSSYKRAFFWYDGDNADNFGAYKLPYADVVDGKLMAIPRGIFAAAGAMEGARGGVDIPDKDRAGVAANINKYYKKMGLESPIGKSNFPIIETIRDVEDILKDKGFTNNQSKILIAKIKEFSINSCDDCMDKATDDRDAHSFGELEIKNKLNNIINLLQR